MRVERTLVRHALAPSLPVPISLNDVSWLKAFSCVQPEGTYRTRVYLIHRSKALCVFTLLRRSFFNGLAKAANEQVQAATLLVVSSLPSLLPIVV